MKTPHGTCQGLKPYIESTRKGTWPLMTKWAKWLGNFPQVYSRTALWVLGTTGSRGWTCLPAFLSKVAVTVNIRQIWRRGPRRCRLCNCAGPTDYLPTIISPSWTREKDGENSFHIVYSLATRHHDKLVIPNRNGCLISPCLKVFFPRLWDFLTPMHRPNNPYSGRLLVPRSFKYQ